MEDTVYWILYTELFIWNFLCGRPPLIIPPDRQPRGSASPPFCPAPAYLLLFLVWCFCFVVWRSSTLLDYYTIYIISYIVFLFNTNMTYVFFYLLHIDFWYYYIYPHKQHNIYNNNIILIFQYVNSFLFQCLDIPVNKPIIYHTTFCISFCFFSFSEYNYIVIIQWGNN